MRYYITTGTSLRDSSRCWFDAEEVAKREIAGDPAVQRYVAPFDDDSLEDLLKAGKIPVLGSLRNRRLAILGSFPQRARTASEAYVTAALEQVRKYFDPACWNLLKRGTLPAELATIRTMQDRDNGGFFSPADDLVFLAGDTNITDAALSAAILRMQAEKGLFPVPAGSIAVMNTGSWDPLSAEFDGVMTGLWRETLSPNVATGRLEEKCRFVLTGGYKGVVLDLAVRFGRHCATTRVYYLHESAPIDPPERGLITLRIGDGDVYWRA